MTWVRLDDDWYTQARYLGLDSAAVDLLHRLYAWSSANLTDGEIPLAIPAMIGTDRDGVLAALEQLLAVNRFTRQPRLERTTVGFRIFDYARDQLTAEELNVKRTQTRDRVARHRARERAQNLAPAAPGVTRYKRVSNVPPSPSPSPDVKDITVNGETRARTQDPEDYTGLRLEAGRRRHNDVGPQSLGDLTAEAFGPMGQEASLGIPH